MSTSGSVAGAPSSRGKSRQGTKDITSTLDSDVVMGTPGEQGEDLTLASTGPMKIRKPDKFTGTQRTKLEPWLLQLDMWFFDNEEAFQEDARKTVFAASCMSDRALKWMRPHLTAYIRKREDREGMFDNYNTFCDKVRVVLGTTHDKDYAIEMVKTLYQNKSAADYAAIFQEYAHLTGFGNNALKEYYRDGLKDSVLDELEREVTPDCSLRELYEESINVDWRLYKRNREKRRGGKRTAGRRSQPAQYRQTTQFTKESYGDPMDLDASTKRQPQRFTKGKKGQKGADGGNPAQGKKCHGCGKLGHFIRDCRSSNTVRRDDTLAAVERHSLDATTQIYPTEDSPLDGQPWEEVTDDSDTLAWQSTPDESSDEITATSTTTVDTPSKDAGTGQPRTSFGYTNARETVRMLRPQTWISTNIPKARTDTRNLGNNPNEETAYEFIIEGKTVTKEEFRQRKAVITNNYLHEDHATLDECGDSRCRLSKHQNSTFPVRGVPVTVGTFTRYYHQVKYDVQHADHEFLHNCESTNCSTHYYWKDSKPMHAGREVTAESYFAVHEYRNSVWTSKGHSVMCPPQRCRDPNCMIPAHHDWKLMSEIAWKLKLTKEDPMHPEHASWNARFCRANNCKYHDKGSYPTNKEVMGKFQALQL